MAALDQALQTQLRTGFSSPFLYRLISGKRFIL
jgi:hypothetical protein